MSTKSSGTTDMTERDPFSSDAGSDSEFDRTLTDLLRAPPLDSQALTRIRVVVENEWRKSTELHRHARAVRRGRWASLAAAVVVIAVTTAWFAKHPGEPAVFGSISRSDAGIDVRHVGDPLRSGDTVRAHGPMLVLPAAGGSLRIAADSTVGITSAADFRLERGKIYVDLPQATPVASAELACSSLRRPRPRSTRHAVTSESVFSASTTHLKSPFDARTISRPTFPTAKTRI